MIKVVVQTKTCSYVIDKDVLWVDIYDGENAKDLVTQQYGYTKDKRVLVPIPNPEKEPESYESTAKRRVEPDPINAWVAFTFERIRLFWKQFLGD